MGQSDLECPATISPMHKLIAKVDQTGDPDCAQVFREITLQFVDVSAKSVQIVEEYNAMSWATRRFNAQRVQKELDAFQALT